jgi:hypothetical protein
MSRALSVGALAATLLAGPSARAYVQTKTDCSTGQANCGMAVHWPGHCVSVVAHVAEPPPNLTSDLIVAAAQGAAAAWSRPALSCTDLEFQVAISHTPTAPAVQDRHNNLVFRKGVWARMPRAAGEPEYDPAALAITTVYARQTDGVIIDADVELNAVNFTWGDLVAGVGTDGGTSQDLQNTLTHEFGHFIGLDHNCYLPGAGSRGIDQHGNQVPDCNRAPPEVQEATMFAAVMRGDILRRTLADDDIAGVCAIYPAQGAAQCPAVGSGDDGGGGCSMARAGTGELLLVVLVMVTIALVTRARRR